MNTLAKLTVAATAAAAAVLLAGCGGSNSTQAALPSQSTQSTPDRTVVGTATLTLTFPNVVTAASVARSTQYINPTGPGGGPCTPATDNLLDIYVDGTLQLTLDNGPEVGHSLCVAATSNGTQTATLPLYSQNGNEIVAIEWDSTHTNVLAIGEDDKGPFTPGTPVTVTLTMLMNAEFIGIANASLADPQKMTGQSYGHADFTCPGSNAEVALYPTDELGAFVPIAGYAGTSTVTASGSPVAGTTALVQTTITGVYSVAWDGVICDDLNLTATAANPAYAIYNSIVVQSSSAVYPGLYSLHAGFPWFAAQLNRPTVNGTVQVHNTTN